jgi:hypothetical protein
MATVATALPAGRSVHLAGRDVPVVLPSWRDARLHLASVIITIHVLGQLWLGFDVSVVQILSAILTCAVIEVLWTAWRTGQLVWPASAMLTGSGVGLILRVPGTENGEYWSFHQWWLFAAVGGLSLATKYVVRYRGSHLFNPSNLGLVLAFLVLTSTRAEPLDFWWAPFGPAMAFAYVVILGGGIAITRRLDLLSMGVAFWMTLAIGIGVVAASGHCMTARWSDTPICGLHFWWVIVTSPEVLIFLFFMITDPRTVPRARVARIAFGITVGVTCTLLMAPQTTEFRTKVALLGGLVLVCAARPLLERLLPAAGTPRDDLGRVLLSTSSPTQLVRRAVGVVVLLVLFGATAAVAGGPARDDPSFLDATGLAPAALPEVDTASLPPISVDELVLDLQPDLAGEGAQQLAVTLARTLAAESDALVRDDAPVLTAFDHGERLDAMVDRLDEAAATGVVTLDQYRFDSLHATVLRPGGPQQGANPGIEATGTRLSITYVDGKEQSRVASPFEIAFAFLRANDGRYLLVDLDDISGG